MARTCVVAFNCSAQSAQLGELERRLGLELLHAQWDVPWEEIAARRAGRAVAEREVPAPLAASLARAEVIFAFAPPIRLSKLAPKLRWLETPATGFDQLRGTGVLESAALVTTFGGLFASVVAEHAFALLLSRWRRLPDFRESQSRAEWKPGPVRELRGATLAIVGLGNIG